MADKKLKTPNKAYHVTTRDKETYDMTTYATNPNHERLLQEVLNGMGELKTKEEVNKYIKNKFPNSPITGEMVITSARKHNISPQMLLATVQVDSGIGTTGKGAKTMNPGNVGNMDDGRTRRYDNWGAGMDAAAFELKKRKKGSTNQTNTTEPKPVKTLEEQYSMTRIPTGPRTYKTGWKEKPTVTPYTPIEGIPNFREESLKQAEGLQRDANIQYLINQNKNKTFPSIDLTTQSFRDESAAFPMFDYEQGAISKREQNLRPELATLMSDLGLNPTTLKPKTDISYDLGNPSITPNSLPIKKEVNPVTLEPKTESSAEPTGTLSTSLLDSGPKPDGRRNMFASNLLPQTQVDVLSTHIGSITENPSPTNSIVLGENLTQRTTPSYIPNKLEYNPDGSMKLNRNWNGIDNSQQVPFSTPSINQIQTTPNQGNTDFTIDPSKVNNYVDAPKVQKRTISTNYNPYEQLVNVFDFGLNTLNNLKNQKTQKENFQPQQPSTSYFNQRSLRGDKVMFAKKGGEYKEGGEYFLEEKEIERLKKLGYEINII